VFGRIETGVLEVDGYTKSVTQICFEISDSVYGLYTSMDHNGCKFNQDHDDNDLLFLFLGQEPSSPGYGGQFSGLLIKFVTEGVYRRVGYVQGTEELAPRDMIRQRLKIV